MAGLIAIGTYLPRHMLDRADIAQALDIAQMRGTRTVAYHDEDSTTMGVEAARRALRMVPTEVPELLAFSTTAPAYADRTNATTIHDALGLPESTPAYDLVGSVRSGIAALRLGFSSASPGRPALVVLSDLRGGLPGSTDEVSGGDAASAVVIAAEGPYLAELIGHAAASEDMLDRWSVPGSGVSRTWDDRLGERMMTTQGEEVFARALSEAGVPADAVAHVIVSGPNYRAVRALKGRLLVPESSFPTDRSKSLGYSGSADAGVLLADVLDGAETGEIVALVVLADGAECLLLRVGDLADQNRPAPPVVAPPYGTTVSYLRYLTWRGHLARDPARRLPPDPAASTAVQRNKSWKYRMTASRCLACEARQLPPQRACVHCGAVDNMKLESMIDVPARVSSFSEDHLAASADPPVLMAIIDFDGGGRLPAELTDATSADVEVGTRLEMTFRRLATSSNGIHNYFWKARPVELRRGQ